MMQIIPTHYQISAVIKCYFICKKKKDMPNVFQTSRNATQKFVRVKYQINLLMADFRNTFEIIFKTHIQNHLHNRFKVKH